MPQAAPARISPHDLALTIGDLVARHGRWRVIRALFTLQRRRSPPDVSELSDHLRRDIGMIPRHKPW
ncbi:MAG: hypothetical protein R3256_06625 [Thalassovita sp.]|nr:hypothetical protein [Thalassovita sp.]